MTPTTLEAHRLAPHDWVPNHPQFPVLCYRSVVQAEDGETLARHFEQALGAHDWPAQWRDGIFSYHHYHSSAHEALGVARGHARLMLGGPGGIELAVAPGDLLVLPAGTGHCCLHCSDDFLVVGAYPTGQVFDICRSAADEAMLRRIAALPAPQQDPCTGGAGPLTQRWRKH